MQLMQLCGFSPSVGLITLSEFTFSSIADFLNPADSEVLDDFITGRSRRPMTITTRVMLHPSGFQQVHGMIQKIPKLLMQGLFLMLIEVFVSMRLATQYSIDFFSMLMLDTTLHERK